tara:strand:- start:781 stop:1011 length:231 start_codon:yes stop_codon:yes gene_type:complete
MREPGGQIAHSRAVHESDLAEGFGLTSAPASLHKKYGPVMKDFGWQYLSLLQHDAFTPLQAMFVDITFVIRHTRGN